jgi:Zn-dependent peptidase ImmA (M78 family)/transcriptional regulator with XRE-family HTH domain
MFNPKRLSLARKRRGLTGKGLAERAKVVAMTVSRAESGETIPDDETISHFATALSYPRNFFFADDPDEIDTAAISFRSLTKMSARERDASIAAGALGLELNAWVEKEFDLPKPNLIDLSYETDMEAAARALRQHWGLGEKPLGNVLGLLESNGVRVFSLAEDTASVDAFSFWRDQTPYVFLNTFKSAEHSIFDSVHELCHLCCHRHAGTERSRFAEREAQAFASAFLMPAADVRSRMARFITVETVLAAKKRWRVSAMAMAYRLHTLGLLTEWRYKSACIELGRRGYRTGEPVGIDRETSTVWKKILAQLWTEKMTKNEIAKKLNLPQDEVESLIWGLTGPVGKLDVSSPGGLRVIK